MTASGKAPDRTLEAVAVFEAAKGAVVLLAGFGLLALLHGEAQRLAEGLVEHLHLNPSHHTPRIFLDLASRATDSRLWLLAASAAGYAALRFAEAWGLWRGRRWAEWFGALSGGVYLPFEAHGLLTSPSLLNGALLALNLAVVAILARALWRRPPAEKP